MFADLLAGVNLLFVAVHLVAALTWFQVLNDFFDKLVLFQDMFSLPGDQSIQEIGLCVGGARECAVIVVERPQQQVGPNEQ